MLGTGTLHLPAASVPSMVEWWSLAVTYKGNVAPEGAQPLVRAIQAQLCVGVKALASAEACSALALWVPVGLILCLCLFETGTFGEEHPEMAVRGLPIDTHSPACKPRTPHPGSCATWVRVLLVHQFSHL